MSSRFLIKEHVISIVFGGTTKSVHQKEKYRFKSDKACYLFIKVNFIIKKIEAVLAIDKNQQITNVSLP